MKEDEKSGFISEGQIKRFYALKKVYHWTDLQAKELLKSYGSSQPATISYKDREYEKICQALEGGYISWKMTTWGK